MRAGLVSALRRHATSLALCLGIAGIGNAGLVQAQPAATPSQPSTYEPMVGQDGKDVIWVPSTPMIIDRMLRMAQVGPRDVVVDLGAGDGRIAIAAARDFGARARGLEYNPDMVALSQREAAKAGVTERVSFEQADIFKADFTDATVVTMYLLPTLNLELRPRLLAMKPGTRIASHQFDMGDWEADEVADLAGRQAYFWVVPAQVTGNWKLRTAAGSAPIKREFDLTLTQIFQKVAGTHVVASGASTLRQPRLQGSRLQFALLDDAGLLHEFDATVSGSRMNGTVRTQGGRGAPFEATRID